MQWFTPLILLCCTIPIILCAGGPNPNYSPDNLNKGLEFTQNIVQAIQQDDPLEFINGVISAVGTFIPGLMAVGHIFSLFTLIFGFKSVNPHEIILGELGKIQDKLEYLDQKLDTILDRIEDKLIQNNFRLRWDKIKDLEDKFVTLSTQWNDVKLQNFLAACSRNSMDDAIVFLHREMTSSTGNNFLKIITKDFDRKYFHLESAMVIRTFILASILRSACIGAKNSNQMELELQVAGAEVDAKLKQMSQAFSIADSTIETEFIGHAKQDTYTQMQKHNRMNNADFAQHLHTFLKTKYYWRSWSVYSYNGDTGTSTNHAVSVNAGHGFYWFRDQGRCLLVAAKKSNPDPGATNLKFEYCLRDHGFPRRNDEPCWALMKEVEQCMGVPLSLLACVRHGNGLRGITPQVEGMKFKNIGAIMGFQYMRIMKEEHVPAWSTSIWNRRYSMMYVA